MPTRRAPAEPAAPVDAVPEHIARGSVGDDLLTAWREYVAAKDRCQGEAGLTRQQVKGPVRGRGPHRP